MTFLRDLWNWRRNAREKREAREEAQRRWMLDVINFPPPAQSESARLKQMG